MSLYNKGSIISSNLIYRPNQGSQVRVLSSRPYDLVGEWKSRPNRRGVCNMHNLTGGETVSRAAKCWIKKISTGLEVVAIPMDECRFESCPRSQKIVVVLQNFEKNQHRCRGKL